MNRLPLIPEVVGSHWDRAVQIDVVAINWRERAVLLGECKWGTEAVGRKVITELIQDKTPKLLKALPEHGAGWQFYYAFFARAGFTEAARAEASTRQAILVDLEQLDRDLAEAG